MKKPSKQDLYREVEELSKANIRLQNKLRESQIEEWKRLRPTACEVFYQSIKKIFPVGVIKVTLEHIDTVGYWFTFELTNDARRQTYCVRHTDF